MELLTHCHPDPDEGGELWDLKTIGTALETIKQLLGNKAYLVNYTEDRQLRSKLPTILHQADMLACQIEKDEYKVHDKPKKESNVSFPKQKLHIPQEALRALKNSLNGGTR